MGEGPPGRTPFTDIVSGTLCFELKHEYAPGFDADGGVVYFDRASVQVSDAAGCHILGHGDLDNPCTSPISAQEAWFLEEAGSGTPETDAVDRRPGPAPLVQRRPADL